MRAAFLITSLLVVLLAALLNATPVTYSNATPSLSSSSTSSTNAASTPTVTPTPTAPSSPSHTAQAVTPSATSTSSSYHIFGLSQPLSIFITALIIIAIGIIWYFFKRVRDARRRRPEAMTEDVFGAEGRRWWNIW